MAVELPTSLSSADRELRFAADQAIASLPQVQQSRLRRLLSGHDSAADVELEGTAPPGSPEALARELREALIEFVGGEGSINVARRGEGWRLRIGAVALRSSANRSAGSARDVPTGANEWADAIQQLHQRAGRQLNPLVAELQERLDAWAGVDPGDAAGRKRFAKALQELLDRLGTSVVTPQRPRQPGRLVVRRGAFYLDHRGPSGRTTFGGTAALPALRLVPAPPNRRRLRTA